MSENPEQSIQLLRLMMRIRRFEEKVAWLFKRGKLPGFVHLYIGEEAVAVGACAALRADDRITSTHRGHGVPAKKPVASWPYVASGARTSRD